jgi:hypothetical protein
MPVYEPGGRIAIVLDCDSEKPDPPAFIVSAMSARESLALKTRLEELSAASGVFELDGLEQLLRQHVHGWRNLHIPFSAEAIGDALGISDMWRLAWSIARQIGTAEKKPEAGSTD